MNPKNEEKFREMMGAMILEEDLIPGMFVKYLEMTSPPHMNYGAKIEAAKKNGTFPTIDLLTDNEVVN